MTFLTLSSTVFTASLVFAERFVIAGELVFSGTAAAYDAGYRILMDSMKSFADLGGMCFGLGLAALGSAALTKVIRQPGGAAADGERATA